MKNFIICIFVMLSVVITLSAVASCYIKFLQYKHQQIALNYVTAIKNEPKADDEMKLKHNRLISIYRLKMESDNWMDKMIVYHDWNLVEKINIKAFEKRNKNFGRVVE